jgi:hypothetical protein
MYQVGYNRVQQFFVGSEKYAHGSRKKKGSTSCQGIVKL